MAEHSIVGPRMHIPSTVINSSLRIICYYPETVIPTSRDIEFNK